MTALYSNGAFFSRAHTFPRVMYVYRWSIDSLFFYRSPSRFKNPHCNGCTVQTKKNSVTAAVLVHLIAYPMSNIFYLQTLSLSFCSSLVPMHDFWTNWMICSGGGDAALERLTIFDRYIPVYRYRAFLSCVYILFVWPLFLNRRLGVSNYTSRLGGLFFLPWRLSATYSPTS